ncbi:recombinase family protein [bacterium]|nr:recombinase family protein [bacterium]
MQFRAQQGLWVTKLPFGTMLGPEKGIPVKDPETWPWVEYIYKEAVAGTPRFTILEHLNQKGVKGPYGGEFGRTTLDRVLTNRFYIGKVTHNGIEYDAKHKCVIDRDLWERAQKKTNGTLGRKPKRANYLFRGKVYTDQLVVTHPENRAGEPVPLVPYYSKGRSDEYPAYYRADKRRKYGGLKAEVVDLETTAWLPSSVPSEELDEAVINALIDMASRDQRQVFMCQAETAAEKMRQEMYKTKAVREKDLAETRRKLKKLIDATVEKAAGASDKLVAQWNQQVEELDLREQQLIGQVQACDDIVRRLELTELETEAAIDQVNSIEEFWKGEDYDRLKEVIDLLVSSVNVRATDRTFEISVRLHPLPVIREVLESTPIERKAAPTGVEPVTPP